MLRTVLAAASLILLAGCSLCKDETLFDFAKEHPKAVELDEPPIIDFGSTVSRPLLGKGWSHDEKDDYGRTFVWAVESRAEVAFGILEVQDFEFIVNCRSVESPSVKPSIRVDVNGQAVVPVISPTPHFEDYRVFVPARVLRRGPNVLGFDFSSVEATPDDTRTLAACFDRVELTPYNLQERVLKTVRMDVPKKVEELQQEGHTVLVQCVPGEHVFTVRVPEKSRLSFQCGFAPDDWPNVEGGDFRVLIQEVGATGQPELLFDHFIDPRKRRSHHRFFKESRDLSRWSGRDVKITFRVTAGYEKVAYPTYALWVDPRIVRRHYFN